MIGGSFQSDLLPEISIVFDGSNTEAERSIARRDLDWISRIEKSFSDKRRSVEAISKLCCQIDTSVSSEAVEVELVTRFLSQSPMSPLVELFRFSKEVNEGDR